MDFYISPFVTAWAMATKRVDKIIDFLLAGIAIFFKPVLIVLFTCPYNVSYTPK